MKTITIVSVVLAGLGSLTLTFGQGKPPRPPRPEPEIVVADMITNFDADENDSLDKIELIAALENTFGRRGPRFGDRSEKPDQADEVEGTERPRKLPRPQNPEEHANRIMARFDENGNESLETGELLNFLDHMHKMRMEHGPRGKGPRFEDDVNDADSEE